MTTGADSTGLQALIFGVGLEIFAIDAAIVREILDPVPTTPVPGAPHFVPSVINVRGNVIPLVDLKVRFGLTDQARTIDTRFVVLRTEVRGDSINVAIMADKVFEVANLSQTILAENTKMGLCLPPELIDAVARWRESIVLIPDLDRVFQQ